MARRSGPSVRSRRLLAELRKLKHQAGLTGDALARAVGMSPSKVSRMEKAESPIYLDDLEKLLDFYRVSKRRRTELLDLHRHALERNWLRMNNPNLPHDWQVWADFEDEASGFLHYQPLMLPGLLQTPEYARAIIAATGHELSDGEIDGLVASRMARQSLLSKSNPVQLHAIIEEGVLTRPFGEPAMRERQIRRLIDASAQPNVEVRILSTDAGLHSGLNGPFVVMNYDEDASLVLVENKISSLFLDEEEHIETYEAVWNELSGLAFDDRESLEILHTIAKTLTV